MFLITNCDVQCPKEISFAVSVKKDPTRCKFQETRVVSEKHGSVSEKHRVGLSKHGSVKNERADVSSKWPRVG